MQQSCAGDWPLPPRVTESRPSLTTTCKSVRVTNWPPIAYSSTRRRDSRVPRGACPSVWIAQVNDTR